MKKTISQVHNAIQNSRKTIEFLNELGVWEWREEYPVTIVHEKSRIKDKKSLELLEAIDFFDSQGFSKENYTQKELNYLKENVPNAIKTAYCLCLEKEKQSQKTIYSFKEKFEHDKWKKIQDNGRFKAFLASSKFDETQTSKEIETELRDIMRSTKEIPALKVLGFVWIVTLPKTSQIQEILEHYFSSNHIFVSRGRKITYIAWSDTLAQISMRHFVNTP